MQGESRSSCDTAGLCQLLRLSTHSCPCQPAIWGQQWLLTSGLNLGDYFPLNVSDDYLPHLLMISAQCGGIYSHDDAASRQGAWLWAERSALLLGFGSPGPCSKELVPNCAGSSSFYQGKQKESGGAPKYKTLEGCSKKLCWNGARPVQRFPPWALPSTQQSCQLEGICSHGVKTPWMLIIRALVLQLHMRFIQYAPLRIYLDPSWLWFPIYTSLRSESDTLSCVLHTDD